MEARSQSAAHPNEMNFIFNLNAFSWKAMQPTAGRHEKYNMVMLGSLFGLVLFILGVLPIEEVRKQSGVF